MIFSTTTSDMRPLKTLEKADERDWISPAKGEIIIFFVYITILHL
jgi:hypothetical protein